MERYREQVRAGGEVSDDEALAVFRLVGRRPDAALVYADAGRRAARYAAKRLRRWHPGVDRRRHRAARAWRWRYGRRRGSARRWLLADLQVSEGTIRCEMADSLGFRARDDGTGCQFYTAAFAELLRQVGDLEWSGAARTLSRARRSPLPLARHAGGGLRMTALAELDRAAGGRDAGAARRRWLAAL